MNYLILFNRMLMVPFEEAIKLLDEYREKFEFKTLAEQQKLLNILAYKEEVVESVRKDVIQEAAFAYAFMSRGNDYMARCAFDNMKKFPMGLWIESLRFLDSKAIMDLLNNFYADLTPELMIMFITNLSEELQLEAIDKYQGVLESDDSSLIRLYYSVSDKGREKLRGYFPDKVGQEDILLKAKELDEKEALEMILNKKDNLFETDADEFVNFVLLKFTKGSNYEVIIKNFKELIEKSSNEKFELFFTRFNYLKFYKRSNEDDKDYFRKGLDAYSTDLEMFKLFKNKFRELGIERTLSLFNKEENYNVNKFSVEVILEFLDITYQDSDISKYINDETIEELIRRFTEKCREKDYTVEDLEQLIKNIGKDDKTKLIYDDYIGAIVACGKLLKEKIIDDKNPLFIELREKFSKDLISRCEKDGTYTDNISLNGIFYRLTKGSMPFEVVYMTKKYKGLIYLTKCGQLMENADYVTNFLTDEQLVKLNISPVIKWNKTVKRKNTNADNLSFVTRMGLQLLCYFGKDKAKYLLESDMQGNLMENLFDGLKYNEIIIKDDGTSQVNEELIGFLFGYGRMKETNSIINKTIRGELLDFRKYFSEFCNEYASVKKACNGVLSVKRIVNFFNEVELPIKLKPDEVGFKQALGEMNTINEERLKEAIGLCKDARERKFSTIPKVSGEFGNFRYEILDLDDPLAVAVGELSHCCFVVKGISYSALKHSMQSKNGRTFVVYYNGKFLTQSWVWRNGDVICFDSVEAGSPVHGMWEDDIKLVDVYKIAADEMLRKSREYEDEVQQVKVVTVGKADYIFKDLDSFKGNVPRPLEENVYVYDSNSQKILAGSVPKNIRYGDVGAQYFDDRKRPIIINDFEHADPDEADTVLLNVSALRYRVHQIEERLDLCEYAKIYSGDGWYILVGLDGNIEDGKVKNDIETDEEYYNYLKKAGSYKEAGKKLVKANGFDINDRW